LALDRPEEALRAYQESLGIRQEIVKKEQDDLRRMADLARSFANCADALLKRNATNDAGAAVEDYKESLKIYEDLAKKEPANIYVEKDLAIGRGNLGEGLLRPPSSHREPKWLSGC
jgi:tetratricopeptide (TPR) repeat protein